MTSPSYPLSFEQESLWIAEQFARRPSPFLEAWAQRIEGPLDRSALRRALTDFVARHAALRTRFLLEDSGSVQRIDPDAVVEMEVLPWPGGDIEATLRKAASRSLPLTRAPFRITLYELSPLDHVLLIQLHHVVVDDVALAVLTEELGALYRAAITGDAADLPAPTMDPGRYALAQRSAGVDPQALDYWTAYLKDVAPLPNLPPYQRPLPAQRGTGCDMVSMVLPAETGRAIRRLARAQRTTTHVVLTTALAMTFSATVAVEDVILGIPTSRRRGPDTDQLFGCLSDLLPLRLRVPATTSFVEVCGATKAGVLAMLRHRYTPYAAISSAAISARAILSGDNLARVVLVIDEDPGELRMPGLRCRRVYVGAAAPKFDWCQYVVASGDEYLVRADYATSCFTPEEAHGMLAQWAAVVSAVIADTTVSPDGLRSRPGVRLTKP
ncbi:hypothetical protein Drose_14410 [Dactylosporangium roseum]|uniref:Condensation domain-containing protein n=1 Tax=Dactylosporangium roseum TaxID=47989 RepID=A0ABY5ZD29_9ACTN|nr:condensation domain-containing protein [Dactylosporangium roseum]UWZ39322.1 hypothetical protein Drose_14410 [Dactylosporangium roseum]